MTTPTPFPPGSGYDILEAGTADAPREFIISRLGTNSVVTANSANDEVTLQPYDANNTYQVWQCVRDANYNLGFKNRGKAGRYLTRGGNSNIDCTGTTHDEAQRFYHPRKPRGGLQLLQQVQKGADFVLMVVKAVGNILQVAEAAEVYGVNNFIGDNAAALGFHALAAPPFELFRWVIPGYLARSSAPYYEIEDKDQRIDQEAIEYLKSNKITNLVSLNMVSLGEDVIKELLDNGIGYYHSPTEDFESPSIERLSEIELHTRAWTNLVYCGSGMGRTGTVVSALQMLRDRKYFPVWSDFLVNDVQSPQQLEVLARLQDYIWPPRPPTPPPRPPTPPPPKPKPWHSRLWDMYVKVFSSPRPGA